MIGYIRRLLFALFGVKDHHESMIGTPQQPSDGLDDSYLIPFRSVWHGGYGNNVTGGVMLTEASSNPSESKKDDRLVVTPKSIVKEIETQPTNFSLEGLTEKIHVLRIKAKLISQSYAKREVNGLIECLECRKKFNDVANDGMKFRDFFAQFDTTTDEKIDEVLKKYKLSMQDSDIFIPEFPNEAIEVMDVYGKKVEEISGKKTRFMVIADEKQFKKAYEKRDPILLAQSPFGFYYHILGAWDEEMICLSDL